MVFWICRQQPCKLRAVDGAPDQREILITQMHIKDADLLHRKGVVVFQINGIPDSQRLLFGCLLRGVLLCKSFLGFADEILKTCPGYALLCQRMVIFKVVDMYDSVVHLITNLAAHQVGIDLDIVLAVLGGGVRKVDVRKVRKIRFAQPFAFTEIGDGRFGVGQGSFNCLPVQLLLGKPGVVLCFFLRGQILVVVDQKPQSLGNLRPAQQAAITVGVAVKAALHG